MLVCLCMHLCLAASASGLQVGENQDSVKYVTKKEKAAAACGMSSRLVRLPATATEQEIISVVQSLDEGACLVGVLVVGACSPCGLLATCGGKWVGSIVLVVLVSPMVCAPHSDALVDGVLVQLPLPKHIVQKNVLSAISVRKDGG